MATGFWYLLLCLIAVDWSLSVSASGSEAKRQPRDSEVEEHITIDVQAQLISSSVSQEPVLDPVLNCSEDYLTVTLEEKETIHILTPGYPTTNYTPGTKCGWNVMTSFGNQLQMKCPEMNMAEDDFLDVWDFPTHGHMEISGKKYTFFHRSRGNAVKIGLNSGCESSGGKGFLCSLSAIPPPSDCECGMKNSTLTDTEAIIDVYYPWLVRIGYTKCVGVIISREWVLTAASCITRGQAVIDRSFPAKLANNLFVSATTTIKHPSFNPHTGEHDIALLRMPPLDWRNEDVSPICMPNSTSDTYSNRMAIAFGSRLSNVLIGVSADNWQSIKLLIETDLVCNALAASTTITSHKLCAVVPIGSSQQCQVKTGGPIVVSDGTNLELVGITPARGGCIDPKLPAFYTRVTDYMDWINKYVSWCDDCCPRASYVTGDAVIYPE